MKVRRCIYIVLENFKLEWDIEEVVIALELWNEGFSLQYIAQEMNSSYDEVGVMLYDLAKRDVRLVPQRKCGLRVSPVVNIQIKSKKNSSNGFKMALTTLRKKCEGEYLALEDLDPFWDEKEVTAFEKRWNNNESVIHIAEVLKRKVEDVIILTIDRAHKGFITSRDCGLLGDDQDYVYSKKIRVRAKRSKNKRKQHSTGTRVS